MTMLRKKWRKRVREIARESYVVQSGTPELIAFRSLASSQRKLKSEFGSGILTSLLLSLMIKLAEKYIARWIEEKMFAYNVPQEFNEDI